jgi:diaminopimelate epimerase
MKFYKYEGTGNDFLILQTKVAPSKEKIQRLCHRHFGIGADGILFATESETAEIMMNYYNADGTVAAMCGNGMRCFVQYLLDRKIVSKKEFTVETLAGLIDVKVDGKMIEMNLGPAKIQPSVMIENLEVTPVTLATEHAIVYAVSKEKRAFLGPRITNYSSFPGGVNTSIVDVINDRLFVETHERGSGWTLSCGTGVAASAALTIAKGLIDSPVTVVVPGGELQVRVEGDVYLKGPANFIAKGDWS